MQAFSWRAWPLVYKLSVLMTLTLVLTVGVSTLSAIDRQRSAELADLENQAALLLDALTPAISDPLITRDYLAISIVLRALVEDEDRIITFARVYNADGAAVSDGFAERFADIDGGQNISLENISASTPQYRFEQDILPSDLYAIQAIQAGGRTFGAIEIALSTAAMEQQLAAIQWNGLVVGAVAVLLGVMLSLVISRLVTQPLHRLAETADRMSAGERDIAMLPVNTRDEVGRLTSAFNRMLVNLRKHQSDLENLNKTLEERVLLRTQELSATNVELRSARDKAEEANTVKGQFMANMSHELRTPLNAIIGYTQLLLHTPVGDGISEPQRDRLERVERNGRHLLQLINEVLDLSKIEAGEMKLEHQPFRPADIIADVERDALALLRGKPVKIITQIDTNLPADMVGDGMRIRQILLNLVSNAAKFTSQGSITLSAARQGEKLWSLTVRDTGLGIAEADHRRIFESFQQVDGTATRQHTGTGLGLTIVHRFVELMSGDVRLESRLGAGSTFIVTLPMQSASEETPASSIVNLP